MEVWVEPLTLPCGHTFCEPCIRRCKSTGASACPTCRHALPASLPRVSVALREIARRADSSRYTLYEQEFLRGNVAEKLVALVTSCVMGEGAHLRDHMLAQRHSLPHYTALIKACLVNGYDMSQGSKARILAAAIARKDYALCEELLGGEYLGLLAESTGRSDIFGFSEFLRALKLLDSPRQARALQKRVVLLQKQGTIKPTKLAKIETRIADLQKDLVPTTSLSGAVCKWARRIVERIPTSKLEFFALQLPTKWWVELADIIHAHPQTGTKVPWFLPRSFGVAPPPESIIACCDAITPENACELITQWSLPYSFVRVKVKKPNDACKEAIARTAPINVCLWWHHELACPAVDRIIADRLAAGERTTISYGKLVEILVRRDSKTRAFFPLLMSNAETALRETRLPLEAPVVVFGDASGSMSVAVETSTIIASFLCALTNAELRFFNGSSFGPAEPPRCVAEVVKLAQTTKAAGSTAPAACLGEYYREKKVVKTFVVVTDEEENTDWEGMRFTPLMKKYREDVYPSHVVFVSFIAANAPGQMVSELKEAGVPVTQFRMNRQRPDLMKLASIVGSLFFNTSQFQEDMRRVVDSTLALALETTDFAALNAQLADAKQLSDIIVLQQCEAGSEGME